MTTRRRIDLNKYEKAPEEKEKIGGGVIIGTMASMMNASDELAEVLTLVSNRQNCMWVSDANWNMHELLLGILNISGPAKIHIGTYAMSETPARILTQLKLSGIITKLYCVLDNRVDTRTAGSMQVIRSIADEYSLYETHAKTTVIENDQWRITIVGSANYTDNKRCETGIICFENSSADKQLTWLKKALKNGNK